MNPKFMRGFLQIGFFVGGGGVLLAFIHPPDSAEFVVSVISAVIGLTLVIGVVAVSYFFNSQ